jgi:hypothetical protein
MAARMPAETGWFAAGKKERGLPSELADGGRPLIWLFIGVAPTRCERMTYRFESTFFDVGTIVH